MPKNDEGEFELVLGNRQLISVFVIVVVLLGVFFSMGYIVGRNSPAGAAENARNEKPKPEQSTDSSDSTSPETSEQTATPPPADAPLAATPDSAPSTPPAVTKPAQPEAPLPLRAKPEPARAKETKPKPSPTPPPATPTQHAAAAGDPASGEYWQVVATARPDAEIIAEALGKKGFHVVLSPAPKDGIFRVLVGPLADAPTQAQTRIGLESAGFKNPIMRKY